MEQINDKQLRKFIREFEVEDRVKEILEKSGLSSTGKELCPTPTNRKRIVRNKEGRVRLITMSEEELNKDEEEIKRNDEKIIQETINPDIPFVEAELVDDTPKQEVETKKETEDVFENGGLEIFNVVEDKNYKPAKRSAESKAQVVMTESDRRFLTTALNCWEMKTINWDEPEQLKERCRLFFQDCDNQLIKPSVELLASYIGVSNRKTITRKINDPRTSEAVREILEKAVGIINSTLVTLAQEGKIPPLVFIFLSKNNYGYFDKTEIDIAPVDNIGKLRSVEDIKSRYLAGISTIEDKPKEDIIDAEIKPSENKEDN